MKNSNNIVLFIIFYYDLEVKNVNYIALMGLQPFLNRNTNIFVHCNTVLSE